MAGINGLENNVYPRQIVFYDENRRERKGAAECTSNSTTDYPSDWGIEGRQGVYIFGEKYDAYVQQYRLDGTGTSSQNKKRITAFSLSNDCKYVYDYYYFGELGPDDVFDVTGMWVDGNGDPISSMGSPQQFQVPISDKYGESSTNKTIWISPPAINWYNVPKSGVAEAGSFDLTPRTIWLRDNASPYDPPTLDQMIPRNQFDTYYSTYVVSSSSETAYTDWLNKIEQAGDGTIVTPQAPSEDTSTTGGGDGQADYDPFSDPVDYPGLPTGGSAIDTGFVTIYAPTNAQLRALSAEMWSDDFITTIRKTNNDPMEGIISLHSVPFQIVVGSSVNAKVGNYQSNVSMLKVSAQYYTLNCGNISLPEHWASALDYEPYTSIALYLPFVGVREMQVDDIMGRVIEVKYNIDILTGASVCMVKCGDSVLYTFPCTIAQQIPYTMSNRVELYRAIVNAASSLASNAGATGAGAAGTALSAAASVALSKHSTISRGGQLGGNIGVMGDFNPYLIIHRPIQSLAAGFAGKKGYPSNISATLSSVSGYTVVDKIHLTNIDCTDTERDEIHALLKDGVIL